MKPDFQINFHSISMYHNTNLNFLLFCFFLLFFFLALSAPPQAVSVVQLTNSSSISVSWEPPPNSIRSGIIQEYKVRPLQLANDNTEHNWNYVSMLLSDACSDTFVDCRNISGTNVSLNPCCLCFYAVISLCYSNLSFWWKTKLTISD